jgi:hypothetical protein
MVNFTPNINGVSWYESDDGLNWDELALNSDSYVLSYSHFKEKQKDNIYYIKAIVTSSENEPKTYSDIVTIMGVSDGEKGEDAITLVITSSNGSYFRNNQGSTILTARLYKGGQEIDI